MKFDTILENKNRGSIDWTIPKGWEISDELQFYVEGSVVRHNKPLRIMGLHPGIQYKPVIFAFSDWAGMMVVEREKSIIQTGLKSNPKRCGIA